MEQIGFRGIIQLSTQIILKNFKHFLRIGLIFALPYALNLILLAPSLNSIQTLVACISLLYKLCAYQSPILAPSDRIAYVAAIFTEQQHYPLSLLIFLFIFSILFFFLICSPLVAFSVCRACTHKNQLDLKGSLSDVSRSAINLVITAVCVAVVIFAVCAMAILVAVIIAVVLSVMNANLTIPMTIWTMGAIIGVVYMAVAVSLADAVAILEEKTGLEAIRRSVYLIKGNEGIAFGLYCVYGVLFMMVPVCVSVSKEASVAWRWSAGVVSVSTLAFITLCGMAAHVVLYTSCKSAREEPLAQEVLDTMIPTFRITTTS